MHDAMTLEQDSSLARELLVILSNIEPSLQPGDSVLIQPHIEGIYTTNAISVPGYDWSQIDSHLRLLCQRGLIGTGGVIGGPAIGIHFSHLTPAGRQIIDI